jgi:hypothetical protein
LCRYVYTTIKAAARKAGLSFTDLETAAVEFLNRTAARADIRLDIMLEPGGMEFCTISSTGRRPAKCAKVVKDFGARAD